MKIRVTIKVLQWALNRAGFSVRGENPKNIHSIFKKMQAAAENTELFIYLTRTQATQLANQLNIPVAYFYLSSPPRQAELPVTDFRQLGSSQELSFYAKEQIRTLSYLSAWFGDYLKENDFEPLTFIGSATLSDSIDELAQNVAVSFGLDTISFSINSDELFNKYKELLEKQGIHVLISSYYKDFNRKQFEVREFRGFAISNKYAPIIFINSSDNREAQLFTLFHELGHLYLGESAVSDSLIGNRAKTEMFCNALAAEILVPEKQIRPAFESAETVNEDIFFQLSKRFKVAPLVIARRALELEYISTASYQAAEKKAKKIAEDKKNKQSEKGAGIPRKNILSSKYGKTIFNTVKALVQSNQMSVTTAAHLLPGASQTALFGQP